MRTSPQSSSAARRRRVALTLALLASLLVAVGGVVSGAANAVGPAPVSVTVDAVTSDVTAPDGTPGDAAPSVLVQIGGTVHVKVSFHDATGAPAAFQKDTTVLVTSDRGG